MKQLKDFCESDALDEDVVEEVTEKYRGKSEPELVEELITLVENGRRNGTFSDERLEEFIAIASPRLDENGKKRLMELATLIRGEKS